MNRQTHRNHSSSKIQARLARVQEKLGKLRDRVRRSSALFFERRQARLTWWQRAFRTPMSGGRWVFSHAKSLWAAFMTLLGLQPSCSALKPRASSIKTGGKAYRQTFSRNVLFAETLEQRQLLAADLFVNATLISGLAPTDTGDNTGYTTEVGEPDTPTIPYVITNTGWTKWVAPVNGTVTVDTAGSSFDTQLGVFTGAAVNALTVVNAGDNDDLPGNNEQLSFSATAGTTYYFQVDGFGARQGPYNLNLAYTPAGVEFDDASTATLEGAALGGPFLVVSGVVTGSAAARTITVNVSPGTAVAGSLPAGDYTTNQVGNTTLEVVIPAGTYAAVPFDLQVLGALVVNNDARVEGVESLSMLISGYGSAFNNGAIDVDGDSSSRSGTSHSINDDDTASISFSAASSKVLESAGSASVNVELTIVPGVGSVGTGELAVPVTVDLAGTGGDVAVLGTDYTLPGSPAVTFIVGSQSGKSLPVSVGIVSDKRVEGDEIANLKFTGLTGPATSAGTHALTIEDDDTAVFSIASTNSVTEALGLGQKLDVTLTLASVGSVGALGLDVALAVDVVDNGTFVGADGSGVDYKAVGTQTLNFAAGSFTTATEQVVIDVINDELLEGNESFKLDVQNLSKSLDGQATLGTAQSVVTIVDDEQATISIAAAASVLEATAGAQNGPVVTLGISGTTSTANPYKLGSGVSVQADVTSAKIVAEVVNDYVALSSPVVFSAGALNNATTALQITTNNDALLEGDENFSVSISNPTATGSGAAAPAATLGAGTLSTVTIVDDESAQLKIAGNSIAETAGGIVLSAPVTLTISGSDTSGPLTTNGKLGDGVTVTATVADIGGSATAKTPDDYSIAAPSLAVSFGPGAVSGATDTVDVTPFNDLLLEGQETINFQLKSEAIVGPAALPTLTPAVATFATVFINDDESAKISIGSGTPLAEAGGVQNTAPVTLLIEGTGTGTAAIASDSKITLSGTVTAASGTATSGTDYTAFTTPAIFFNPGDVSGSVSNSTVKVTSDLFLENTESFGVTLSLPVIVGGVATAGKLSIDPGANTASVSITDDEKATVSFKQAASEVHEQGAPILGVDVVLTVSGTGTGPYQLDVPVTVTVNDKGTVGIGKATGSGTDYTYTGFPTSSATIAKSTPLTVGGSTTVTTKLAIVDDGPGEGDETVDLKLASATTPGDAVVVVGSPDEHTVTITDRVITIVATDSLPVENQGNFAQFKVFLSSKSATPTVVSFNIDGSSSAKFGPAATDDYVFGPNVSGAGPTYSVTIPANSTFTTIDIDITDDSLFDPNETIKLNLVSPAAPASPIILTGTPSSATMKIVDNESANLKISGTLNAAEDTTNGKFTVTLTDNANAPVSVQGNVTAQFTISGSAIYTTDYSFTGTGVSVLGNVLTVVFTDPGAGTPTSQVVNVLPVGDNVLELTEGIVLTPLSVSGSVNLVPTPASVTLADNDGAIVRIAKVNDATETGTVGNFTVDLIDANNIITTPSTSDRDTKVNFNPPTGGGTLGTDYYLRSLVSVEHFDSVVTPALPAGWTTTNIGGATVAWQTSTTGAVSGPNAARIVGVGGPLNASDNGLETPVIAVVSPSAQVRFQHSYNVSSFLNQNGARLEIKIGAGAFTEITAAGGSFVSGGYTGTATTGGGGPAWNGNSGGNVNTLVNLPAAAAGQNVQFRFRLSEGAIVSGGTWSVDEFDVLDSANFAIIKAGLSQTNVAVVAINDLIVEPTETVVLTISSTDNPTQITKSATKASDTLNIIDNDSAQINVSVGVTGIERNLPAPFEIAVNASFDVTLTKLSSTDTQVPFTVTGGDTDTLAGLDYSVSGAKVSSLVVHAPGSLLGGTQGKIEGLLTIPAMSQTQTITIEVLDDEILEDDEPVVITLGTPLYPLAGTTNASVTVGTASKTVLIQDLDLAEVNVNVQNGFEQGPVSGKFIVFLVDPATGQPTTSDRPTDIPFELTGGDANYGNVFGAGVDYKLNPAVTGLGGKAIITIPATKASASIDIIVNDDTLIEQTETVEITLFDGPNPNPGIVGDSNITLKASAITVTDVASIFDNDKAEVTINAIPLTVVEGEPPVSFTVNLGGTSSTDTLVTFIVTAPTSANYGSTLDYTLADPADPTNIYFSYNSGTKVGTIRVPAGSPTATIELTANNDMVFGNPLLDNGEQVTLQVTTTDKAPQIVAASTGNKDTVTIIDFNASPAAKVDLIIAPGVGADATAAEADNNALFTVSLAGGAVSATPTVVNYTTNTGVAVEGTDYDLYIGLTKLSGQLTLPPGQNSVVVDVKVINDSELEITSESVILKLASIQSADASIINPAGSKFAQVDILRDQTISVAKIQNGAEGGASGIFRITMTEKSLSPTTVSFVLDGDAQNGGVDYTQVLTATIPTGSTSVDVNIAAINENLVEDLEHVSILLKSITAGDADITLATTLYSVAQNDNQLRTIDASTGASTVSVPLVMNEADNGGSPRTVNGGFGLAVNPSNGRLYSLVQITNSVPVVPVVTRELVLIDPALGVVTSLGLATDFEGIAFNAAGDLYGVKSDTAASGARQVFQLDPLTGAIMGVGTLFNAATGSANDIAFDPNLSAFAIGDGDGTQLQKFTPPGTMAGLSLAAVSYNDASGLTHARNSNFTLPSQDRLFLADNIGGTDLYQLDFVGAPTNAYVSTLKGSLGHTAGGLAFVNSNAKLEIADNDFAYVKVQATDDKASEPAGIYGTGEYTFTLSNPSDTDTVVNVTVTGSATPSSSILPTSDDDYSTFSKALVPPTSHSYTTQVTIPAGKLTTTLTLNVLDDLILEPNETVTITLDNIASGDADIKVGTPSGKMLSFEASDDTYLDSTNGSSVFGAATTVKVGQVTSPTDERHALLQFTNFIGNAVNQIPANTKLSSAFLQLTTVSGSPANIRLHEMVAGWTEALTWDGALLNSNASQGLQADGFEAETLSIPLTAITNVTTTVQDWINGIDLTNLGWALLPSGISALEFVSSEGLAGSRPTLVLNVDTSATVTIYDDDVAQLSIAKTVNAAEDTTVGSFTVSLPAGMTSSVATVVTYQIITPTTGSNPQADLGSDYAHQGAGMAGYESALTNGTVTIPAGQNSATILIAPFPDNFLEGPEDLTIKLITPPAIVGDSDITISPSNNAATMTIADDETATVTVTAGPSVVEGTKGEFTVTISKPAAVPVTVNYTVDGSSTARSSALGLNPKDYEPLSLSVTIPANQTSATIFVDTLDDNVLEATETVKINLTAATSLVGVTASGNATVSITDDEVAELRVVKVADAVEPGTNGSFALQLINTKAGILFGTPIMADSATTIDFLVSGTATPKVINASPHVVDTDDYKYLQGTNTVVAAPVTAPYLDAAGTNNGNGRLTLSSFTTQLSIPVEVYEDQVLESPDETVIVTLKSTLAAGDPQITPSTTPATVTIIDEKFEISIKANATPGREDGPSGGGNNGQFTVSITNPVDENTVVTYTILSTPTVPFPDPANRVAGGTGINPTDYTHQGLGMGSPSNAATGTVTITAGQTSATIDIQVLADSVVEGDESVTVQLSSFASYVSSKLNTSVKFATPLPTDTQFILDDDTALVSIAAFDPTAVEPDGPAAASDGKFRITMSKMSDVPVTIYFTTATGPTASVAQLGTDYTSSQLSTGSVTLPAGQTTTDITLSILPDTVVEANETVTVTLGTLAVPSGIAFLSGQTGHLGDITLDATKLTDTVTITDSTGDSATEVSVSVLDGKAFEPGNASPSDGRLLVSLTAGQTVSVDTTFKYNVSGVASLVAGGVADPADYTHQGTGMVGKSSANFGTVTIPAGSGFAFIDLFALNDNVVEGGETAVFTLDPVNPTAGDGDISVSVVNSGTITIYDEGLLSSPGLEFSEATIVKTQHGNEAGLVPGIFTINLSNPVKDAVTVYYQVVNAGTTATHGAGNDYTLTPALTVSPGPLYSGSVSIPAGVQSTALTLNVLQDLLLEGTENVEIKLTDIKVLGPTTVDLSQLKFSTTTATVDIIDDDFPTFTVTGNSLAEGSSNANTNKGLFTVKLSDPINQDVTLDIKFASGTATSGTDFDGTAQTVTFTKGSTTPQTILLPVFGDNTVERDETLTATITLNSTVGPPLVFTVDSTPSTATIANDDTAIIKIVPVAPAPTDEGDSAAEVHFMVSLTNPIDIPVTVDITYADGTAKGEAFKALPSLETDFFNDADQLTFNPGDPAQMVSVKIRPDTRVEGGVGTPIFVPAINWGSENFVASVELTPASVTALGTRIGSVDDDNVPDSQATGVIQDNDGAVVEVVSATSPIQENTGVSTVVVQLFRAGTPFNAASGPKTPVVASTDTIVTYTISSTDPDVTATDFSHQGNGMLASKTFANPTGTVLIPAGSSTAAITITTLTDLLLEDDETITVTIDGFTQRDPQIALSLTDFAKNVLIQDVDVSTVSVTSKANAGDDDAVENSANDGTYTFSLTNKSDRPTVITYSLVNLNQLANPNHGGHTGVGADYSLTPAPFTVTIPAGSLTATVTLDALDDVQIENDQIVRLTITNATGNPDLIQDKTPADIKIIDDGDGIKVNIVKVLDGVEPTTNGSFNVFLTKYDGVTPYITPGAILVQYITGGTAEGKGADYTAVSGIVSIPAGKSSAPIDIAVLPDAIVEGNETVIITLDAGSLPGTVPISGQPLSVGTGAATLIIQDANVATFTVEDFSVAENALTKSIKVTLSNDLSPLSPSIPVTVNYQPGTALLGSDYKVTTSQVVTFNPGDTAGTFKTVTLDIVNDAIAENNESFGVTLSTTYVPVSGGVVVNVMDSAVGTITDDDAMQITGVRVTNLSATPWNQGFKDAADGQVVGSGLGIGYPIPTGPAQTAELPWSTITHLHVAFTNDIDAATVTWVGPNASVKLLGILAAPTINNVAVVGNTMLIELSTPITTNNLTLQVQDTVKNTSGAILDGDWNNNVQSFNSGGAVAADPNPAVINGNDFKFHFVVNPGNGTQNAIVNNADANLVYSALGTTPGSLGYNFLADYTGNGVVNNADANVVYANLGSIAPVGFPGILTGGGLPSGLANGGGSGSDNQDNPPNSTNVTIDAQFAGNTISGTASSIDFLADAINLEEGTSESSVDSALTEDLLLDDLIDELVAGF